MKKMLALLLCAAMLTGCTAAPDQTTSPTETQIPATEAEQPVYQGDVVDILLEGQNVTIGGAAASDEGDVYISRDIVYYEQKTHYDSGNPYGEGSEADMHAAQEAADHLVVNITAPGNYRLSGRLDLGQIRIDLGEDAREDPDAVVVLILDGVEITCTVAPAILFRNVYECDGNWSVETATPDVDTTAAGANLILAENSENVVNGSYVAKIYKDKEGEKKLVKQDGAIYSYMSMNVFGPGSLNLNAENEGLDTELHLTIHGGNLNIRSGNDGINTNEDGVSVTTIRGGNVRIVAGLGEEGDGIDSNGYLVIRGGTVISAANPASDAGLDSDLGSYIHGGTVVALGAAMDWAESDSGQVTMNLQFSEAQRGDIQILREDGTPVFTFAPAADPVLGENFRSYRGAILSCADFRVGDTYVVFVDGIQMAYTGTDVMTHPGGFRPGEGGQRPEMGVTPPDEMPEPPEADFTIPPDPGMDIPMMPQGEQQPPAGTGQRPEDWTGPEGDRTMPDGQRPPEGHGGQQGEKSTLFYMQDMVNFFSGLTAA